jgi:hypothetical protein
MAHRTVARSLQSDLMNFDENYLLEGSEFALMDRFQVSDLSPLSDSALGGAHEMPNTGADFSTSDGVADSNADTCLRIGSSTSGTSMSRFAVLEMSNGVSALAKRPTRPCDGCRRRKSRCVTLDGQADTCVMCKSRNEKCTFLEHPRKRLRKAAGDDDGKRGEEHSRNSKPGTVSPDETIFMGNDATSISGRTGDNAGNERCCVVVDDYAVLKGPSLLKKTLGLQNSRCSFLLGPTGILDYSLLSTAKYNARQEAEGELPAGFRLRRSSETTIFLMEEDTNIDGYRNIKKEVDAIEELVAPYGKALLELYFRVVHPAYPILHTKVVFEKYSRSYHEFVPPILASVYGLALNWWKYAPNLPQDRKPGCELELNRIAVRTFNEIMTRPKLSTVQAGLLILQNRRNDEGSWAIMSQVVAMSEELGLHLDCREWKIPRWERKLRRRLAWAVWVEDKWQALTYWRPSHISNRDYWMVTPLTDDDFPDKPSETIDVEGSSDITSGRLIFMRMVSLTNIVDDIVNALFSPKSMAEVKDITDVLSICRPLQGRLKDWLLSLPEDIRMSSLKSRKFSSSGYLYLAYLATEITLHRRILHAVVSVAAENNTVDVVRACRNAARQRLVAALDFVRDLRPEHVQAFWHSSAISNFALIGGFAGLLWATATDEEEREFFKSSIKNYSWMLRVSSAGSEQMAAAIKKLDLVSSFLPFMSQDGLHTRCPPNSSSDSEYSEEDAEESFVTALNA